MTKSLCFLHFLVDMSYLFSRDFSFNLIQYLRCSTIILFYLKFGFWLYNKYMDYCFYFNWWWEILSYYWFYYFKQYHILKDYEMLHDFIWFWFYYMYILKFSACGVSPQHRSYVVDHGPGIRVMKSSFLFYLFYLQSSSFLL